MSPKSAWGAALLCVLSLLSAELIAAPAEHRLQLRLDPAEHNLQGADSIALDPPRSVVLLLSPRFRVDALRVDSKIAQPDISVAGGLQRIRLPRAKTIDLRWSGGLAPLPNLDHRATLSYAEPVSDANGSFLPSGSGWYPMVDGELERYSLELDLPADQRGLVPGRLLEEKSTQGRYRARFGFDHPAEGISLMAGPYRIQERQVRTAAGSQVRLRTYFHPQLADLAQGYLDSVAAYLDLYESRIGPYPYSEFSVVSSPTPTGFGMPSLTYLGIDVLRLPFIRATSLGHEVLHNWWGNGVYPDYAKGNWSEGLTTFMADYAYREQESPEAARAVRLAWLRDYAAMPKAGDAPLAHFTSRTHGASQIVGYNKAAMLFFMLREEIGEKAFNQGLRDFWTAYRFRMASWDDLRAAFEQASGRHLAPFFQQWLMRTGAPELRLVTATAEETKSGWHVQIELEQGEPPYALSVPLRVRTAAGEVMQRVELREARTTLSFTLHARPIQLELDPDLHLMRRLTSAETPPILRDAMLAERPGLIVASNDANIEAAARTLAGRLLERASGASADATTLLVVGRHADIDRWLKDAGLAPRPAALASDQGSAQVWTARGADGRTLVLVSARNAASIAALTSPLPHYGRQSYIAFDGARAILRGIWPGQAQVWNFRP